MNYVSAKEARKYFNCTGPTLHKWISEGKLKYKRFSARKILYDIDSMNEYFIPEIKEKKNVIYARVSNTKQSNDLLTQVEMIKSFCFAKGIKIDNVYKDIASGMNENRKEFNLMLDQIMEGNIDKVYISFKDRLTRFGFDYFKHIFAKYHTEIIIIDELEETSKIFQQELTEDLISIIHHFSMKLYSGRRKAFKEINKILKTEGHTNIEDNN